MAFMLRNPLRKWLSDRDEILRRAGVFSGSTVLEVGAGNGFFTEALLRVAARVIAVEVQAAMAEKLRLALERSGTDVGGLTLHVADISSLSLPVGSVDVAFLYFSLHEVERPEVAAQIIENALRTGGRVALFEPKFEVDRRAMDRSVALFEGRGFRREYRKDGWFVREAVFVREG